VALTRQTLGKSASDVPAPRDQHPGIRCAREQPCDPRGDPRRAWLLFLLARVLIAQLYQAFPVPGEVLRVSAVYFAKVRAAYTSVHMPEPYHDPRGVRHIDAKRIRREFLQPNPVFDDGDLAVVCSQRYLHEVRICLDKELRPDRSPLARPPSGRAPASPARSPRHLGGLALHQRCDLGVLAQHLLWRALPGVSSRESKERP
jgi:hypothetical protein